MKTHPHKEHFYFQSLTHKTDYSTNTMGCICICTNMTIQNKAVVYTRWFLIAGLPVYLVYR